MRKLQIILTSLLLMVCGSSVASAQGLLKGLADKAKDKVKQKIEQKVENTVDNAADRVLNGKKSKKNNSEATETQEVEEAAAPSVTTSNVKSDKMSDDLEDLPYQQAIDRLKSRIVCFTFYFE